MTRRFALVVALGLAACGSDATTHTATNGSATGGTTGTSSTGDTTGHATPTTFTGPSVAYNGRFVAHNSAANTYDCAWSGSSITTRFTGTQVSIGLTTASNSNMYFNIAVDGGTPTTLRLSNGVTRYTVMSPDPKTAHTVRWTKISEAAFGSVTVSPPVASADGALQPTQTPSGRKLEFVGDSITVGYGILGTGPYCAGTVDNQDADLAYPALVGQAFAANYMQLGFSGRGVATNADCSTTNVVPELYAYAIPPGVENASSVAWDASQYSPDVIVLNIGTNDFAAAGGAGSCNTVSSNSGLPLASTFETAYAAFLQNLVTLHPAAYIIIMYGPMLTTAQMSADAVRLNSITSTVNNANIQLLPVGPQGAATGCDYHPNVATHTQMAQALVTAIEALPLGWTADP